MCLGTWSPARDWRLAKLHSGLLKGPRPGTCRPPPRPRPGWLSVCWGKWVLAEDELRSHCSTCREVLEAETLLSCRCNLTTRFCCRVTA